jgi:hypothetical protein
VGQPHGPFVCTLLQFAWLIGDGLREAIDRYDLIVAAAGVHFTQVKLVLQVSYRVSAYKRDRAPAIRGDLICAEPLPAF